jgi:hypothetical protein
MTQVNGVGDGIPNLFTRGMTTLDATAAFQPRGLALKISAGNLLNRPVQEFIGDPRDAPLMTGRTYSVSFSLGS